MADELEQRYQDYLIRFNASLPADLSDEDRKKMLLEALSAAVDHDLVSIAEEATTDQKDRNDKITILEADHAQHDVNDQLDQVRQSL